MDGRALRGRQGQEVDFQALVDQLAYLIDEIDMLRPVLNEYEDEAFAERPRPQDLSVKQLYGGIVVVNKRVSQAIDQHQPDVVAAASLQDSDFEGWNAKALDDILVELRDTREELVAALRQNESTLESAAHIANAVVMVDLRCQQQAAERLFDMQRIGFG